jgi:hypothetical protein
VLILDYDRQKKKKVSKGITIVTITIFQVIMKFASKITGIQSYEIASDKNKKEYIKIKSNFETADVIL